MISLAMVAATEKFIIIFPDIYRHIAKHMVSIYDNTLTLNCSLWAFMKSVFQKPLLKSQEIYY